MGSKATDVNLIETQCTPSADSCLRCMGLGVECKPGRPSRRGKVKAVAPVSICQYFCILPTISDELLEVWPGEIIFENPGQSTGRFRNESTPVEDRDINDRLAQVIDVKLPASTVVNDMNTSNSLEVSANITLSNCLTKNLLRIPTSTTPNSRTPLGTRTMVGV